MESTWITYPALYNGTYYKAYGTPEEFMSGVYHDGRLKSADHFAAWLEREKKHGPENEGALKTSYKPGLLINNHCLIEQTSWIIQFSEQPGPSKWEQPWRNKNDRCLPNKDYVAYFIAKEADGTPAWQLFDQDGYIGTFAFTPTLLRPSPANPGTVRLDRLAHEWDSPLPAEPIGKVENRQIWSALEAAAGDGMDTVKSLLKPLVENVADHTAMSENLKKISAFAKETNLTSLSELAQGLASNIAASGKILYIGGVPVASALNLRRAIEANGNLETRDAQGHLLATNEETEQILTGLGWRKTQMPFQIGQAWSHPASFDERGTLNQALGILREKLNGKSPETPAPAPAAPEQEPAPETSTPAPAATATATATEAAPATEQEPDDPFKPKPKM